uniref:alpha/beta fold hydrolase n=1 Tax=Pedobacter schmidteae TaxID=2201271 RepID=UPI000EB5ACC4|nr:alpha/beta fold hydrolase [Pedobacter schmidteae]
MKLTLLLFLMVLCGQVPMLTQSQVYPIHPQFKKSEKPVIIFLTGDGGWNSFSILLADELGRNGYPVVSLDTRKYFWKQKTPAGFAADMNTIISKYLTQWNKDSFYVLGYSFGAEVAAFLPAHLPVTTVEKFKSMVLLSPGYSNSFEVRFINMIGSRNTNKDKYKVYPELLKSTVPVYCIFGDEERTDISHELKETGKIRKNTIPGSHHYNNDVKAVVNGVLKGLTY